MANRRKPHVTSLRLDDFQLEGLRQMKQRQDRSRSWLIGQAIDRLLEEELHVSRAAHEAASKAAYDAELLASFTPRPYRIPVDTPAAVEPAADPDAVLDARIEALLEEHQGEHGGDPT